MCCDLRSTVRCVVRSRRREHPAALHRLFGAQRASPAAFRVCVWLCATPIQPICGCDTKYASSKSLFCYTNTQQSAYLRDICSSNLLPKRCKNRDHALQKRQIARFQYGISLKTSKRTRRRRAPTFEETKAVYRRDRRATAVIAAALARSTHSLLLPAHTQQP